MSHFSHPCMHMAARAYANEMLMRLGRSFDKKNRKTTQRCCKSNLMPLFTELEGESDHVQIKFMLNIVWVWQCLICTDVTLNWFNNSTGLATCFNVKVKNFAFDNSIYHKCMVFYEELGYFDIKMTLISDMRHI